MLLRNLRSLSLVALGLIACAGCAQKAVVQETVFFPPPPDPPRVQFLMGISSSEDVEGKEEGVRFFSIAGAKKKEKHYLGKPYGLAAQGSRVAVCDTAQGAVFVMDFTAKTFTELKGNKGGGKLKKPIGVAFDGAGNIFVADSERKDAVAYDKDGNYLRTYGKGQVEQPVGVAADDTRVFILDNRASVIKIFDRASGEAAGEIGKTGNALDSIAMPIGLHFDGSIFRISNVLSGRILTFDADGHFISGFGQLGDAFGMFSRPRGVFGDKDGIIYVVDGGNQTVQLFNEKGRVLLMVGAPGLPQGSLDLPSGVAVVEGMPEFFRPLVDPSFEAEKIIFVSNQYGPAKLSVYALGHQKGMRATVEDVKASLTEEPPAVNAPKKGGATENANPAAPQAASPAASPAAPAK